LLLNQLVSALVVDRGGARDAAGLQLTKTHRAAEKRKAKCHFIVEDFATNVTESQAQKLA